MEAITLMLPLLLITEITELPPRAAEAPRIPWVTAGDASWKQGEPMFRIGEGSDDASAEGWAAVTDRDIRLHVRVKDDVHENHQTGNDVWNGDAIQLGIDGRGDGSGTMDP